MSFYKGFASRINSLRYSCEGSFFVCATIMLPVIFIAIGMALDISSWMYYRNSLKQASHTTILAASTELSESLKGLFSGKVAIRDIQQYAKRYLEGTLVSDFSKEDINKIIRSLEINIEKDKDNTSGAYIIQLHSHYDMSLNSFSWAMHAIGIHSIGVDVVVKGYARPESSHKEMAASIQMVIDVSGSMGFPQYIENESQQPILLNCYGIPYPKMPKNYFKTGIMAKFRRRWTMVEEIVSCDKSLYTVLHPSSNSNSIHQDIQELNGNYMSSSNPNKMVALRDAVAGFIKHLQKIKNIEDKVRMSAVTFSADKGPVQEMSWGLEKIISFFARLDYVSGGGTDTFIGMQAGYKSITDSSQNDRPDVRIHNLKARKYIIFMTDGSNSDTKGIDRVNLFSRTDLDTVRICQQAKKEGIMIFAISFQVPADDDKKRVERLLKSCATSSDTYFDVHDSERLNAVFKEVASTIFKRVVRVTQ